MLQTAPEKEMTVDRTGVDVLLDAASGAIPMPPAGVLLGWQPLEIRPGFVRVLYTAREEFYNPQGAVQGGFIAAMLDDAMGPAAFTLLPATHFAPTLEMSISYLRPAHAGALIAEGSVVHRSRRFIRVEGTLMTEDGELIATGKATVVITEGGIA
jgi:uncharacterized protein (TIGR00369 family)